MKLWCLFFICILSLPGLAQEDDDALIEGLKADRTKHAEAAIKIDKAHENMKEAILDVPAELKKLGYESVNAASLMDDKVIALFQKMIKQSNLKSLPPETVAKMILFKAQGTPVHGFLVDRPKLVDAMVEVMRDDKALSGALGIFQRKDDLKIYFFIWIGFMVLAWLFKKIFFNKKWSRGKTTALGLVVSLSFSALSITTFYHIFYDELSPTTKILWKHWRKRNLKT